MDRVARRRSAFAVVVCVLAMGGLLAGGWTARAQADVFMIGDTPLISASPTLNGFAPDVPVFQGDASSNYVVASPVAGKIVSWSFLSAGAPQGDQFVLRVLRSQGTTGTTWTAEATSPLETVTSAGAGDALQGPFAVDLPIEAGDRIALEPLSSGDSMPLESGALGDGFRTFLAPFADGSSASIDPTNTGDNGQLVPIQATVVSAPINTALPAISGPPRRYDTLTATPGLWTGGVTGAFAYQWLRCATATGADCIPVAGATGPSYLVTFADIGFTMRMQVTATNAEGSTTATSVPTARVTQGVLEARLSITPSYNGDPTQGSTCTGLAVRIDGSDSVSPDGISAYSISEVDMSVYAPYENQLLIGAAGNAFKFHEGDMPDAEVQSRITKTFHQPTVITTFGWSRQKSPVSPGDPAAYQYFAVDPVGILLTVQDFAGAIAKAFGVIGFVQFYSNQSRAGCPPSAGVRRGTIGRLTSVVSLLHEAIVTLNAARKPSAVGTKLMCVAAVTCRGAVSIGPLAQSASVHRPKRPVVFARSFFAIAPHHRLLVRAPLTRAGVRYLASLRRGTVRRLALTIRNVGPTGKQLTRSSKIDVRRP